METVDGILINPELPENFDDEDIDTRDHDEFIEWSDKPFILKTTWDEEKTRIEEFDAFWEKEDPNHGFKRDWDKQKRDWFREYPSGTMYQVRCLDGGAWDRSSNWGTTDNIEDAVDIAKNGPLRRRKA